LVLTEKLVPENNMKNATEIIATQNLPSRIYNIFAQDGSPVKAKRLINKH
jgi:hypothetical protein